MDVKAFVKKEPVLVASLVLVLISLFFATPSTEPSDYASIFKTICVLFCFMTLIGGISRCNAIAALAQRLLKGREDSRSLCLILVFLPFFCAMLFSNDVALLTFVPIAIAILTMAGLPKKIPLVIILQTVAANVGSFLTPFGNPHNLVVFNNYAGMFTLLEYEMALVPTVVVGAVVLAAICLLIKKEKADFEIDDVRIENRTAFYAFCVLFVLSIVSVLGFIPYWMMTIVIVIAVLVLMPKLFLKVDYSLLLTFFLLFVFANTLSSVESVNSFLGGIMESQPFLTTTLTSQFTTNVASTIMLSEYTTDWAALMVGANAGCFGTPIASMANIITLTFYLHQTKERSLKSFFKPFAIVNALMLLVMIAAYFLLVAPF